MAWNGLQICVQLGVQNIRFSKFQMTHIVLNGNSFIVGHNPAPLTFLINLSVAIRAIDNFSFPF